MLLALKPPTPMQHDIKPSPHFGHIHDYSTSTHSYKPTYTSSTRYSPPESPRNLPSFYANGTNSTASHSDPAMSSSSGHGHSYSHQPPPTSHHRGLPPPSASGFSLPPPTPTEPQHRSSSVAPPPPPAPVSHHVSSLGQLPAPPSMWSNTASNSDDAMRTWLHAKAEEDRRRQEEEKTRQETLRLDRSRIELDQRRLERDMLRDALERGIPPAMVPLIFAGLGTGAGSETSLRQAMEFVQSYMQNLDLQQRIQAPTSDAGRLTFDQQLRPQTQLIPSSSSPDLRREREQREARDRSLATNPYGPQMSQQGATFSSHRGSFSTANAPSAPLSKLNTVDFAPQPRQQLHPSLSTGNLSMRADRDDQITGSTSNTGSGAGIFFHHWTPPTGTSGSSGTQQPPTPGAKSIQGSPFGSQTSGTHGHLRKQQPTSDVWENSPKKRKVTHQPSSASSGGSAAGLDRGGGPITVPPAQPRAQSTEKAAEDEAHSEGSGSGRDDRQQGGSRESLRPSSRQQRREEELLQGGGGNGNGGQPHRYEEHRPTS